MEKTIESDSDDNVDIDVTTMDEGHLYFMLMYGESDKAITLATRRPELLKMPLIGESAVYQAAKFGRIDVLKCILDLTNDPDMQLDGDEMQTGLCGAASEGHMDCMRLLLERGADTSLDRPYIAAIDAGNLDAVKLLVEFGADMNIAYPWFDSKKLQYTPLSYAIATDQTEIADYLRSKGAKLTSEVVPGYVDPKPKESKKKSKKKS